MGNAMGKMYRSVGLPLRRAARLRLGSNRAVPSRGRINLAAQSAARPSIERMEGRLLLSAYALSAVASFGSNATGVNPECTLVADSGGNLYGTATTGGAYEGGTVFEVASGSRMITIVAAFNGTNGSYAYGSVTLDAAGTGKLKVG